MINFEQVTIIRGGRKILDDINLSIPKGQKVVLTGPSGSGKTTLLMAIAGAVQLDSGSVFVDSLELNQNTVHQIRQWVSFIGQEPILGTQTVEEALVLPYTFKANRHREFDRNRMHEVLKQLKLSEDILSKRCSVISGGEKQRVAISRALLLNKHLFLADELTSALDPESKQVVLEMFVNSQQTVLSVSHDRDWAKICDRILELRDGRLVDITADAMSEEGDL